jgi:hypothetical protein
VFLPSWGLNRAAVVDVRHSLSSGGQLFLPTLRGLGIVDEPGPHPKRGWANLLCANRSADRGFEFGSDPSPERLESRDGDPLEQRFSRFDEVDDWSSDRLFGRFRTVVAGVPVVGRAVQRLLAESVAGVGREPEIEHQRDRLGGA